MSSRSRRRRDGRSQAGLGKALGGRQSHAAPRPAAAPLDLGCGRLCRPAPVLRDRCARGPRPHWSRHGRTGAAGSSPMVQYLLVDRSGPGEHPVVVAFSAGRPGRPGRRHPGGGGRRVSRRVSQPASRPLPARSCRGREPRCHAGDRLRAWHLGVRHQHRPAGRIRRSGGGGGRRLCPWPQRHRAAVGDRIDPGRRGHRDFLQLDPVVCAANADQLHPHGLLMDPRAARHRRVG